MRTAVFAMKLGKAPGNDGLPVEFYRTFWQEICKKLYELYQSRVHQGGLNRTACQGIISLLPKGNKDTKMLKNWRSLTLLNLDYKILAKIMATRLKKILPKLIGPQQTGFMEKRLISDNIVRTMEVIAYANSTKKRQLIITVDFEKCFDRVAYSAIYGSLKYFGIDGKFVQWIRLFFTDFQVCTQNMGWSSKMFNKGRSVNQGCNISPYLFLLCGEVMAHKILFNPNINGITMGDIKRVISQFVDDTVIYINYDLSELNAVINTFTEIERHTGLKINYDKTTIYRVGSLKHCDAQLYTAQEMCWSSNNVELLGIEVPNGPLSGAAYDKCIAKMEKVCQNWHLCQLSLIGKILVINTLMSSIFVYKMMVLPDLIVNQLKKIDMLINKFIWKGKRSKIPLKVLRNPKEKGGLRLVNFVAKQNAIKISWIHRIMTNDEAYGYIYYWLILKLGHRIWEVNLKPDHVKEYVKFDKPWKYILMAWCCGHYQEYFSGKR